MWVLFLILGLVLLAIGQQLLEGFVKSTIERRNAEIDEYEMETYGRILP